MLKHMIKKGYVNIEKLLLENYVRLELSENELAVILKLIEQLKIDQLAVSVSQLSKKMSFTPNECSQVLNRLFNRGLITLNLEYTKSGKTKEAFNIDCIINEIEKLLQADLKELNSVKNENSIKDIIDFCEQSFNKALSPNDLDLVVSWVENNEDLEIIKNAIVQAAKRKTFSVKYVDQTIVALKTAPKQTDKLDDAKSQMLDDFFRNIR